MGNIIFETRNLIFDDIICYPDIKILKNSVTFIAGASGTGKSTLLRLLNSMLEASSGEIVYKGKNIGEIDSIELRREILLVSQSVFLFDTSIKNNFINYYEYRGEKIPSDQEIKDFLDICCISFSLDKDCTTMSGGERHRVYIAIYLSFFPRVIMFDEPTSALDKQNSHNMIKNILLYCQEKNITPIIVSHDQELAYSFAENIIKIEKDKK